MIITWQQVQIMRGESPKSYVRVVRGLTDLRQSTRRRTSSGRRSPPDGCRECICMCMSVCIFKCLHMNVFVYIIFDMYVVCNVN